MRIQMKKIIRIAEGHNPVKIEPKVKMRIKQERKKKQTKVTSNKTRLKQMVKCVRSRDPTNNDTHGYSNDPKSVVLV